MMCKDQIFSRMDRLFLVSLLLSFIFSNTFGQNLGLHRPGIKWKEVDTKNVRVIYPEGHFDHAVRIASVIDEMALNHTSTVGEKKKKVDLVLQTEQVVSNGYVGLAPWRSEFFGTPFQSTETLGTLDWLDVLSIHEYQHVLQNINGRRGFTILGYLFGGQNGWAVVYNLSIPDWYSEGDATMAETVLTNAGRGRTPAFFKEQRALLLNDLDYNYMKARNGSYKDIVPTHYPLGYTLTNYGRNKFGTNIWRKVLADGGKYSTIFYPFSGAMKRHMGIGSRELYKVAYEDLKKQWKAEIENTILTQQALITPEKTRTITNYNFPVFLANDQLVVLKDSYHKTPAIYLLDNGKERLLTKVGIAREDFLSGNGNKLAWTEFSQDPRWRNTNFNDIVAYDLITKSKRYVKRRTKFFSPEFSNNGRMLVAVQNDAQLASKLVILDATDGAIINEIENKDDYDYSYPKWSRDDQAIIFIARKNNQVAILKYNIESKITTPLTAWTSHTIGGMDVGEKLVVFSASFSGIDNIYSAAINGRNVQQITSVKIGAYNPTISNDDSEIVFSEYTPQGHQLSKLSISDGINKTIELVEPKDMARFNITLGEKEGDILASIPKGTYEEKSYKGLLKGTQLHSWGFNANPTTPGANILFRNILNDFDAILDVGYNLNERSFRYNGGLSYAKLYPQIDAAVSFLDRRALQVNNDIELEVFRFRELTSELGLTIPWQWIQGNLFIALNLETSFTHRIVDFDAEHGVGNLNFVSNRTGFTFSTLHRRAAQHLQSRLGLQLAASFETALNASNISKSNFLARVFLPGITPTHGLRITTAYQKEDIFNPYQFSDQFRYARGINALIPNNTVFRTSFDYQFPILYPDIGFWGIVYCKRIRANLFTDLINTPFFTTPEVSTYGAELIFELNFFNVQPLGVGVRKSWSWLESPGARGYDYELLITLDL